MLALSACGGSARSDSAAVEPVPHAREIRVVPLRGVRDLRESSGAAASRRQPSVVFTIDDSGNSAALFALDTTGADRGTWRVSGASNTDWESLSFGPCENPTRDCLYIGDTGDNRGTRPSRVIYRFAEPNAPGARDTVRAEKLRYVYADRPHDVEAMYVARATETFSSSRSVRCSIRRVVYGLRSCSLFRREPGAIANVSSRSSSTACRSYREPSR